jgi:hypothetical protein
MDELMLTEETTPTASPSGIAKLAPTMMIWAYALHEQASKVTDAQDRVEFLFIIYKWI